MKDKYRKNKTDFGRTIVRKKGTEEPLSAKANWDLWVMCQDLKSEEMIYLITVRKSRLKYEEDFNIRNDIRREIMILEDAIRIMKRKNKEVKK